jgi:hypothetical protein
VLGVISDHVRSVILVAWVVLVTVACAESNTSEISTTTTQKVSPTTTEPPTFCDVAKIFAMEVLNALENDTNEDVESSPMNTKAFWLRYKQLQTKMRDLAPAEIKTEANIAWESAMAAYDYMEKFEFSMLIASRDPKFAQDQRFTGKKYLKAGATFQNYIDKECRLDLTK